MKTTLREWVQYDSNEKELRKLFYNMSTTMKYIHSYDYYISSFNLRNIEILNPEKLSPIQYNYINKMPSYDNGETIEENIYNLVFMQIGIYTNTLDNLRPQFLKENFNLFEQFLPEEDIPYFKGVILRRSPVYYCDYVDEKNKREVEKLAEESDLSNNDNGLVKGIQKVKSTQIGIAYADKETQELYSDLADRQQAAFASFLIIPLLLILLGLILSIVVLFNT